MEQGRSGARKSEGDEEGCELGCQEEMEQRGVKEQGREGELKQGIVRELVE